MNFVYTGGHFPFPVPESEVWDGLTLAVYATHGADGIPWSAEKNLPAVGPKTGYPFGFTLDQVAYMYWRARAVEFAHDLDWQIVLDSETQGFAAGSPLNLEFINADGSADFNEFAWRSLMLATTLTYTQTEGDTAGEIDMDFDSEPLEEPIWSETGLGSFGGFTVVSFLWILTQFTGRVSTENPILRVGNLYYPRMAFDFDLYLFASSSTDGVGSGTQEVKLKTSFIGPGSNDGQIADEWIDVELSLTFPASLGGAQFLTLPFAKTTTGEDAGPRASLTTPPPALQITFPKHWTYGGIYDETTGEPV